MSDPKDQVRKLERMAEEAGLMPGILGPDGTQAVLNSQRPKIRLPGDNRELGEFAKEVGAICKERNLFRRDITPVIINEEKGRLDTVSAEMLRTWVETHLVCFKEKTLGNGDDKVTISLFRTMNVDTSRGTLAAWQFWSQLPEIERVNATRLPVIMNDKRIVLLPPGYFREQGIYTLPDGPPYNEEMTLDQARAVIDDLLQYFPFHDEGRSKSVVVAAMLTMFCASMLAKKSVRPAFIYTANSVSAGKTLLAKVALIPVCGSASTRTFPRKEEMRKVLDGVAMDAASYVLFDNIRGKIGGEEIEAWITAPEWEGRVMGESTKFKVDNVSTVFMTGNQSHTTADMADRSLWVELFVHEADVRERKIPKVMDDATLSETETRSLILSALWSFVRSWDAAGRPTCPERMPRFESWSQIVAAIVAHVGYGNCVARPEIAGTSDESKDMHKLVLQLAPEPDTDREEWKFDDIMKQVHETGLFEDAVPSRGKDGEEDMFSTEGNASPAARSYFGKLFGRFADRLFRGNDGERFRFVVEGRGNNRKYVIVRDTPAAPSPSASDPF